MSRLAAVALKWKAQLSPVLSERRAIICYGLYCFGYVILHGLTNFYPLARLAASPWSPETGLTVAASVLLGWPTIPLAIVSHIVADSTTRAAPFLTVELPASLCYALAYAGPGSILRRWLDDFSHASMSFLTRFIAIALVASFMFAGAQAAFAIVIRDIPIAELTSPAFTLAVGDLIGILTISPALLLIFREPNTVEYLREHILLLAGAALSIMLICLVVFGMDSTDHFKFFYLLFLPVIVLSIMLGFPGAVFGVLITDTSMMTIIYWRELSPSTATELQVLMISLSITGLLLGATVHERGMFKTALTLSQRKLGESQSLLLHSSRVAVVNEMSTALAHELNQPLSAIRTYLRAIQRMLGEQQTRSASVQGLLEDAVAQVDNADTLIKETRNFLRRDEAPLTTADLRQIISTSLALMEAELRSAKIDMSLHTPKVIPLVWASEVQIQQVIVNLLRNAIEAVAAKDDGKRSVILSVDDGPQPGSLKITISDTGDGIPPEMQGRLFEPFATSKTGGLGLGLALCRSIITAHGGDIWLEDRGTGRTSFSFVLPVSGQVEK